MAGKPKLDQLTSELVRQTQQVQELGQKFLSPETNQSELLEFVRLFRLEQETMEALMKFLVQESLLKLDREQLIQFRLEFPN